MLAFVFPGQGSQAIGMLAGLAQQYSEIKHCFAEASDVLGFDLWQMAQAGPEADLNRTENTQPVLLTAGVALYRAWRAAEGAVPALMAGHSLGEYSALVCAEALSFADALRLVRLRGQAMQRAVPEGQGAMAAILNADLALIEAACAASAQAEIVAPANLNAPGQIVISGHKTAVDRCIEQLAAQGIRKAIRLPVSVPSHCALMQPAAAELEAALAPIVINQPAIPVVQNVTATAVSDTNTLRANLLAQLCARVRWIESVQAIVAGGAQTLIECGPGKALSGMNRRIAPEAQCMSLAEAADFATALKGKAA
jgi:[acyl-carrier-protein] S-malonyltransferase